MAFEIPDLMIPMDAAVDLSASQYCAVVSNATGKAALPASAGLYCVGVVQNKPEAGESATVMTSGITKMKASAAILGDALVSATTAGTAKTAVATEVPIGKVMGTPATAANQIISVLLTPGANAIPE